MRPRYELRVTPACERDIARARSHHPARYQALLAARELLARDPYNRGGHEDIRKLEAVPVGEGQYRLRVGDYRLRYDVVGEVVLLYSFRPRREAYRRRER